MLQRSPIYGFEIRTKRERKKSGNMAANFQITYEDSTSRQWPCNEQCQSV